MTKATAWIQAARLRTLPLALSTILTGGFLAAYEGIFRWDIFMLCLLTTFFLQILSNFANDYGDSFSGVDGEHRVGPSRTIQQGLLTHAEMKGALITMSALSFLSGVALIFVAFPDNYTFVFVFLLLGVTAILAAIKYTVGKNPYGYIGLGDLFVFIFFGLVGVAGTYFLFAKELNLSIILPAASLGFFSVGVLNINNIRDIASDRQSGKISIPVRLGKEKASFYHLFLLLAGILCTIVYVYQLHGKFQNWLFLLSVPLFFANGMAVTRKRSGELDPYLRQLALSTLLFVVLLGVGLMAGYKE